MSVTLSVGVSTTSGVKNIIWAFGDGNSNSGNLTLTSNTYNSVGNYTGSVEVDFKDGQDDHQSFNVSVLGTVGAETPPQQQIQLTSGGSIDVGFSTNPENPNPGDQVQLQINFINKQSNAIQPHIDYKVIGMQDNNQVFGIPITHTAAGSVNIPIQPQSSGTYRVTVEVDGILFQPIPPETATFSLVVGTGQNNPTPSSVPTNLNAVAISPTQITLTWLPPVQNYGKTIIGYKIDKILAGGVFDTIVGNTESTSPTYSIAGLASGTTYTFRVEAIYSDDTSTDPSNWASATTLSTSILPTQPTPNTVIITPGDSANQNCVAANDCFNPSIIQVPVGATVTWQNEDTVGHTATSGQPTDKVSGTVWDSSLIKAGGTYTTPASTFQNPGIYYYFCQVHPWMIGEVAVGQSGQPFPPSPPNIPPNAPPTPTGPPIQYYPPSRTNQVNITPGDSANQNCVSANNCFDPMILHISPGETVTWTNSDTAGHTTTSGHPTDNVTGTVWDSSLIKAGGTYTTPASTFQNPGIYYYFCQVHPWMIGEIIVGNQDNAGGGIYNEQSIISASQQDVAAINAAKNNQTIAAQVNIGNQKVQTESIDNNVQVHTNNSTSDFLNVSVSASSQTGPKIIVFNLGNGTINVGNLKYLGIMYDGQKIEPATSIDSMLHAKNTDNPSFAIVVTQEGAQILVLIPHFSTHNITITNMSKVIPAVPEFGPMAGLVIALSIISVVIISRRFRFHFSYHNSLK